jgi:Barstar (barnase inhibitor)
MARPIADMHGQCQLFPMSKTISVDCARISDWDTFHDEFSKALRFPDFYGGTVMHGWIA